MTFRFLSLIRADAVLELSFEAVPMPRIDPPGEVTLQMAAAPVNPSACT